MSTNVEHARPTRTDRTTDADAAPTTDPQTATEPSATTDPAATSTPAATGPEPTADATPPSEPARADAAADSWTRRCQRQFEPGATDRLANLVDEENLVVVSPGTE